MKSWIRRRIQRLTGAFILLVFLLVSFSVVGNLVICIGPDGHMALESAQDGVCSDWYAIAKAAEKTHSLKDGHCKRCVDLPVIITKASTDNSVPVFQSPIQMPVAAVPPTFLIGYLETSTENQLSQPPPTPPPVHTFLRTVVLLI
jgi:hypothetical protein